MHFDGGAPLTAEALSFRNGGAPALLQSRGGGGNPAHCGAVKTQAKRYLVSGSVQGVGFRFFAERLARQLGVSGYVKNLSNGSVEIYAIGNAAQLEALRTELQRGPRSATVDAVTEAEAELLGEFSNGFTIEREY